MKPAISVHNLSKEYRLGLARTKGNNLTENLRYQTREIWDKVTRLVKPNKAFSKEESFWALKDVSFDVQPGEVVGIIGRNGAGKSTLLKVLSQIVEPTSGHAVVRGRLGSLLEVGTGFHPELTGRENIYMNGAILGMKREEINRKFDEIVAFAEVEKFLDTPVKRYSSGMYVRLAFAVAAHLEPEILIVDEVLAVGDQAFQQRCTLRMREIGKSGRTIIFVSHNMPAISNLCDRCVMLQAGKVVVDGKSSDVIRMYNRDVISGGAESDLTAHRGRTSDSMPTMSYVKVVNDQNNLVGAVPLWGTARIEVLWKSMAPLSELALGVVVKDAHQTPIFGITNKVTGSRLICQSTHHGRVICRLPNLPLMPGTYSLDLYFGDLLHDFDVIHNAADLTIVAADVYGTGRLPPVSCGNICLTATWELS
ncbi:MAG TPA: ABC transporter ATP-binding protein [Gemmatales bacterium]|nr:ABC transporter ATP-binding protein [Gemmatales bacterium]